MVPETWDSVKDSEVFTREEPPTILEQRDRSSVFPIHTRKAALHERPAFEEFHVHACKHFVTCFLIIPSQKGWVDAAPAARAIGHAGNVGR